MASTPLCAPVQAELDRGREKKPAATIDWAEHVEAWEAYAQRYGRSQSAERIAERERTRSLRSSELRAGPLLSMSWMMQVARPCGSPKGKWEGQGLSGTFDIRRPASIQAALDEVLSQATQGHQDLDEAFAQFAAEHPEWECSYDAGELYCGLTSTDPHSDAHVSVSSCDADLLGQEPVEFTTHYQAGSDYQGAYGVIKKVAYAHSLEDLHKLLRSAEAMLRKRELAPNRRRRRRW